MQPTLNLKSARSQKARFARPLDSAILRKSLWLIAILCAGGWGWLIFLQQQPVGHLLLSLAGLAVILLAWYYGELSQLKPSEQLTTARDISSVLDRRVLANLKPNASPKTIARAVAKHQGGYFYASRYGVNQKFLQELSSDDPITAALVWQKAIEVSLRDGHDHITAAAVIAGLIMAIPAHDTKLAPLKVDAQDVLDGVAWYSHIENLIDYHRQKHNFGGIGRDLSFGWAPLLNNVGYNITDAIERSGFLKPTIKTHDEVVNQMVHLLSQPGRRNAVLVGEIGVGKSTVANAFAQKLISDRQAIPSVLQYNQVFTLDAANLIANAPGRGQLEELLMAVFSEAIKAKNVILFLDEAQLFMKEGTGSVDLSNILLPVIEGGGLRLILSLSDQEWLRLSQSNPGLAQLMNRVALKPLDQAETLDVMQDQALNLEGKHGVVYMYQGLKEAYRLSDRFIHEQAFPGKAIRLMEAAAGFPEQQYFITAKSVQQAVEKSFDVKVQTADTEEEKSKLLNLEEQIHGRMVNQTRAVTLVSDALRRARAGVRNENKPIGTFLFLGPTGVGKTELSKALAAVYFGGEDRMVRIDLNEYSRPGDTSRLLATGSEDPYSLCAQISKQPFSVVLLDEIEKAHPNVLNLLLQMLDEGVLRDTQNKPISFKDAIIIATSNAGADKIRAHIDRGEKLEEFEEEFLNELINANIFRPEFLNRFDETVLFRPLSETELLQVVDLLLAGINRTLAGRKVSVALDDSAKKLLASRGYDPRLGARPLRRVMQRAVENIVAQGLLSGEVQPGQTMTLSSEVLEKALNERS